MTFSGPPTVSVPAVACAGARRSSLSGACRLPIGAPLTCNQGLVAPNKIGPYLLTERLGEGGFSVVRLAVHEGTGRVFACKIVPQRRVIDNHLEQQFDREVAILEQCRHPCVCQMFDFLRDAINYYLVLELCDFGNLRSLIIEEKKLSEGRAGVILKQLMQAVGYLHSMGIAHRDIKPENILVDPCDRMKLIDFGLSNFQSDGALLSTHVGSAVYAAPECIFQKQYDGFKSDIWSCGIVLFTMLCGTIPWVHTQSIQLLEEIRRCDFFIPMFLSPLAQSLIKGMIVVDLEKRLSVEQILQHPWLRDAPDPPPLPAAGPADLWSNPSFAHRQGSLPVMSKWSGGSQTKPDVRKLIALGKGRMKVSRASNIVAPVVRPPSLSGKGLPPPIPSDGAGDE